MKRKTAIIGALLVAWAAVPTSPTRAGHEFPYYPSYYPQEIRLETVTPLAAARLLQRGALHAFIGEDPYRGTKAPVDLGHVESLGSYVVVMLDGPSVVHADRNTRCALADRTLRILARSTANYVYHPYPITPYHADYLHHFDLIQARNHRDPSRAATGDDPAGLRPNLRAKGVLAERLVGSSWRSDRAGWDATVEHVDIDALLSARGTRFDGWLGPPWLKEGWFHAYLTLAERIKDKSVRHTADAIFERLVKAEYTGLEGKLNLERTLVSVLTDGCEAVIAGYTVKREYFNAGYSTGIENIAFDSHTGLNSAMFTRTAKLKDFPWNGWLKLGINTEPAAAWNPIGGFTDAFGRLVWSAAGDPALLPAPYSAGWIENRVTLSVAEEPGFLTRLRSWLDARTRRAGLIRVPRDALIPEPKSGLLRRVGAGKQARTKIVYRVLASSFHDGTQMGVGDVLYPYIMAYRWSDYDSFVEKSTALLRERLVGFRIARVDKRAVTLGDIMQTWLNPVVEVYLNTAFLDPQQAASLAPSWASVPWHVMVLMEEAVRRGVAAFSQEEARHRRVEWLDVVRRAGVKDRLAALVEEFGARGYIPEALKGFVTVEEARQRWRALSAFYKKHGHFLVTNGPYRLEKWTGEAAVLTVFRDLSYPLGIGSFDTYPVPHRGYISALRVQDGRLHIRADVEIVEKFGRTHRIAREPLVDTLLPGATNKVRPACRYVGIGLDGRVLKAGTAGYAGGGVFAVDLKSELAGLSAIMVGIFVDENHMIPEIRMLHLKGK